MENIAEINIVKGIIDSATCTKANNQLNNQSNAVRETFVNSYIQYLLKMKHISTITRLDGLFFQLILFLHPNTDDLNTTSFPHKIRDNCFYVNKIFQNSVTFQNHGQESQMYTKYITEFCKKEITQENIFGTQRTFYGCDFDCTTTFNLISEKIKNHGFNKEQLLEQQKDLKQLRRRIEKESDDEHIEFLETQYNKQMDMFKQNVITVKNICIFRKALQKN